MHGNRSINSSPLPSTLTRVKTFEQRSLPRNVGITSHPVDPRPAYTEFDNYVTKQVRDASNTGRGNGMICDVL